MRLKQKTPINMKYKIEKETYWFLIVAVCNFIYSPIVSSFLNNPNLSEGQHWLSANINPSYIYILIGLIWLMFSVLYLIADTSKNFKFARPLKRLHFFLTIGFIFGLMLLPVLDTFQNKTIPYEKHWFLDILSLILPPILFLTFLSGIIIFIVSLVKALLLLVRKK